MGAAQGRLWFPSDEAAIAYTRNPIDNLKPLLKRKFRCCTCVVKPTMSCPSTKLAIIEQRYKELGGSITMIVKPNCNHHPHSLKDPTRIVNFVLEHTGWRIAFGRPRRLMVTIIFNYGLD